MEGAVLHGPHFQLLQGEEGQVVAVVTCPTVDLSSPMGTLQVATWFKWQLLLPPTL